MSTLRRSKRSRDPSANKIPMVAKIEAALDLMAEKMGDAIVSYERKTQDPISQFTPNAKHKDFVACQGVVEWRKKNDWGYKKGFVRIFFVEDYEEIEEEPHMWDSKLLSRVPGQHLLIFVMNQTRGEPEYVVSADDDAEVTDMKEALNRLHDSSTLRLHPERHGYWFSKWSRTSDAGTVQACRVPLSKVMEVARGLDPDDIVPDVADSDDEDSVEYDSENEHRGRNGRVALVDDMDESDEDEVEEVEVVDVSSDSSSESSSEDEVVPDEDEGVADDTSVRSRASSEDEVVPDEDESVEAAEKAIPPPSENRKRITVVSDSDDDSDDVLPPPSKKRKEDATSISSDVE